MITIKSCFQCGDKGEDMYGYPICNMCKAQLGLFTDTTIRKHLARFKKTPEDNSYEHELKRRLAFLDEDYIKKRIKLLHVLARLESFKET